MKAVIKFGLPSILGLLISTSVYAIEADIVGARIVRVLVTGDSVHGGCMALLDRDISTSSTASVNLDCLQPGGASDRWVTFACNAPETGVWPASRAAQRTFEMAQLAYALQSRVRVKVDDSRKINGHCFSSAIQVYQ
ncbi:MAG: hypothetical protein RJQ07_07200 [Pseudomonadales bacterium]